jgi:hypothetical protein
MPRRRLPPPLAAFVSLALVLGMLAGWATARTPDATTAGAGPAPLLDLATPIVSHGSAAELGVDAGGPATCILSFSGPGHAKDGPFAVISRFAHIRWTWRVRGDARRGVWKARVRCGPSERSARRGSPLTQRFSVPEAHGSRHGRRVGKLVDRKTLRTTTSKSTRTDACSDPAVCEPPACTDLSCPSTTCDDPTICGPPTCDDPTICGPANCDDPGGCPAPTCDDPTSCQPPCDDPTNCQPPPPPPPPPPPGQPDTTPPSTPTGVKASSPTQTSLKLTWIASTDNVGVTAYALYRDGTKVANTTSLAYTFGSLACGHSYKLGVAARDAAGNQSGLQTITASTSGCTWSETVGGVTHTWTNYTNAGGTAGANIAAYQTVRVSCRRQGFVVADGNPWWYRIASSPWNNAYYASADAFYNNGATSGSLIGTPFVDTRVRTC